jgi:hypothetical protein
MTMIHALKRLRHKAARTRLRAPLVWLRHRGLDPSDVFLASYPKSGSTWLRFQLFEVLTGASAGFYNISQVFASVGMHRRALPVLPGGGRFIQTHHLYRREYKRAVYVFRDVRDVILSEYKELKGLGVLGYVGLEDFDDFVSAFLRGKVNGFGAWNDHIHSWLGSPIAKNGDLMPIRYDDLREDPEGTIKKILDFVGVDVNPRVIQEARRNNSVERMQAKEERELVETPLGQHTKDGWLHKRKSRFVGGGSLGGWRVRLTDEQVKLIQKYAGSGLERAGYSDASSLAQSRAQQKVEGNEGVGIRIA